MNINRARKAYSDFTGHTPKSLYKDRLDDKPVAGYRMGSLVGVAYEATRDGKTEKYFHRFGKKARPDLVARDDGKQLYITRGKYKVTDRGVEDMPQLFVVNPSPRRHKISTVKRKPAMAKRRRARRTRQVAVFNSNPVRRRRRRRSVATYRANPIRRRRRIARASYRRNPSRRRLAGIGGSLGKMILPAMGIGLGAVGSEMVMGYLPLPANLKTGVMRHITKGGVSIALGLLIGKVLKMPTLGKAFAAGGIAIATHDAVKEAITRGGPGIKFGEYLPRGAARGALGMYVPPVRGSLGYYSPASTVPNMAMGGFENNSTPNFRA